MVYICGGMIRGVFAMLSAGAATIMGTRSATSASNSSAAIMSSSVQRHDDDTMTVERVSAHECDCAPLWTCMTEGRGDCSELEKELRMCMSRAGLTNALEN